MNKETKKINKELAQTIVVYVTAFLTLFGLPLAFIINPFFALMSAVTSIILIFSILGFFPFK